MKKIKRRNFFVNKNMQGEHIFLNFLVTIAGVVIFALIFGLLSADRLTLSYENQVLRIGQTPSMLLKEMLHSHGIFILTVGVLVAVLSMFMTHRFAGPFFRLEKTMEKMLQRDLSDRIRLRPRDHGKELADRINGFNDLLESDLKEAAVLCDSLEAKLGASAEAHEELRQLKELISRYTTRKNLPAA